MLSCEIFWTNESISIKAYNKMYYWLKISLLWSFRVWANVITKQKIIILHLRNVYCTKFTVPNNHFYGWRCLIYCKNVHILIGNLLEYERFFQANQLLLFELLVCLSQYCIYYWSFNRRVCSCGYRNNRSDIFGSIPFDNSYSILLFS